MTREDALTAGGTMARVPPVRCRDRARPGTGTAGCGFTASGRESLTRHLCITSCTVAGSPWHRPCKNWRMAERPGSDLAAVLFDELAACRKRGIERLDRRTHNQQPVPAPQLENLAAKYASSTRSTVQGRIPRLKYLFRDAVATFREEDEMDAELVSELFFGDSQHRVTKSAGELLDIAQRKFGYDDAIRFRETRHAAFERFAEYLPRFVARAARPAADTEDDAPDQAVPEDGNAALLRNHNDSVPAAEVQRHIASTGYIDDGDHFVTLLSQAENVTIVGYTNESLASMLRLALARKREAMLRPDICWSSVRVVFLTDDLLDRLNDERGYPDVDEARLLRRRLAVYGRRTVRIFLRSLPDRTTWAIYDSSYFPPLIGSLLEMPDGQRIVQMVVRRPQRSGPNHLYLELEDTRGHYFSAVFDEIVDNAVDDNKLVPAGHPTNGERFRTNHTRYRRNVLLDGANAGEWLPMVLVITWQMRVGRAEPLLQLRTERNSNRELERFTHLAGHVTQEHRSRVGLEFGLADPLPLTIAAQRVQMETGESGPSELTPLCTGTYFHSDKEHLFFFVYSCRLPDGQQLWPQADMFSLSVPELVTIRENQVLRNALMLCQDPPARRQPRVRGAAFDIMAQNLILHGHADIARSMTEVGPGRNADLDAVAAELRPLEEGTRTFWAAYDREREVVGLSGFQFREFYRILLPFYESVGVPGASRQLRLIRDDESRQAAADRLSELYADERVMASIPIEL